MENLTSAPSTAANKDLLISLLENDAVPMHTLQQRYAALLELVRILIGVVPNCDRYLEIWPPAFRTYNLLVPNFLNLPFSIFGIGGATKELVGLGMYVASRTAECPYCSAHTCSFALRRGADPRTLAQSLLGGNDFSDKELATIAIARSLSQIPCDLSADEFNAIQRNFTDVEAEWIVLGIAMMGFLNKFMDAIGVQLESSTVAETRKTMGEHWTPGKAGRDLDRDTVTAMPSSDNLRTRMSAIKYAPSALMLDMKWQKGVPSRWPDVGEFLRHVSGYDFPMLSMLKNKRAARAIAAVLRENLDAEQSVVGIDIKIKSGVIFSSIVNNHDLEHMICNLGTTAALNVSEIASLKSFANNDIELPGNRSQSETVLLTLARAASPSPAEISASVVRNCDDANLTSAGIVELITWLSVLQMLHRLSRFLLFSKNTEADN